MSRRVKLLLFGIVASADFSSRSTVSNMGDNPQEVSDTTPPIFHTRSYQQELLEESLRSNIIIALDTGSGKTHIAVLRMKHEVEREP